MSKKQRLRALVAERLTAAAEEVFALVERTMAEYEEELSRSKEENQRKQRLLEQLLGPQVPEPGAADVQSHWFTPESRLKPEIPEPPKFKEETEEQSVTQEGEQLPQFTETSPQTVLITKVFSLCGVKEEHNHSAEPIRLPEASITSSLHQQRPAKENTEDRENTSETEADGDHYNQVHTEDTSPAAQHSALITKDKSAPETRENTLMSEEQTENSSDADSDDDWNPPANSSAAQMETEADGDHYNQVQINNTGPAAHNSALFRKYKSAAETSATVTYRRTSEPKRKHECTVCKKTFTCRQHLAMHTRIHTGEKAFSCSVCKKSFTQKITLTVHMRRHTGERPYSCSVCQRMFAHSSTFIKHKKTHTGERPYSCSTCMETFAQKSHLTVHMRRHTGERPYSCVFCHKTFIQKGNLTVHLRSHRDPPPKHR